MILYLFDSQTSGKAKGVRVNFLNAFWREYEKELFNDEFVMESIEKCWSACEKAPGWIQ